MRSLTGLCASSTLTVALAVALLAPASAGAAPGDPACAPDKALPLTFEVEERGQAVPLVATHEVRIRAEWSGDVRQPALSVPDGIRVLGTRPRELRLIAPVSAGLAVTASWEQARDPSDPDSDPSDAATRCVATQTTALPITAAQPSQPIYDLVGGSDGYSSFAVVPDQGVGDLSPLEVSVRVTSAARFPSPRSKAKRMPVAMRPSERVRYRKRIPHTGLESTPVMCRFYYLTCGPSRLYTEVQALGERASNRRVTKRDLRMGGAPLARTQPYRLVAPHGIKVNAFVFSQPGHEPPALGYDIQVRQSGRLVARVRRALRCGKVPNGFGERFYRCRVVRRANG